MIKKFQAPVRKILLLSLAVFIVIEWRIISHERAKYGIASGNPFVKEIALTFDDGPRENTMQGLNSVLLDNKVRATFFLVGKFAERYPDVTRMLYNSGHEIANHTYTHPKLFKLWTEKIEREAERVDEVMTALNIPKTRFLRPPGGSFTLNIFNAMRRKNLRLGLWSLNTGDYTGRPAEEIERLVLSSARPGTIVLMHSGVPETVKALPKIIKTLRSRGYEFVTVNDLWNNGAI